MAKRREISAQRIGWSPECFKVEPGDWKLKWEPPDGFVVAAVRHVRKQDGNWVTLYLHLASKKTVKAMRRKLRSVLQRDANDNRKRLRLLFRGR